LIYYLIFLIFIFSKKINQTDQFLINQSSLGFYENLPIFTDISIMAAALSLQVGWAPLCLAFCDCTGFGSCLEGRSCTGSGFLLSFVAPLFFASHTHQRPAQCGASSERITPNPDQSGQRRPLPASCL
jgi:hypothetical protein